MNNFPHIFYRRKKEQTVTPPATKTKLIQHYTQHTIIIPERKNITSLHLNKFRS